MSPTGNGPSGDPITRVYMPLSRNTTQTICCGAVNVLAVRGSLSNGMGLCARLCNRVKTSWCFNISTWSGLMVLIITIRSSDLGN